MCRLYPYEYMPEGIQGLYHACPASKDPFPDKALEQMGMRSDRVSIWHRTLYEELSRTRRSRRSTG
ncbi:MAG: hypothetical protein RRA32_07570 [bacterium]|nr:hypothetical protein [bacterium]